MELSVEQKQSDFVAVHVLSGHFACTPEIRSPSGDVAALVEGGQSPPLAVLALPQLGSLPSSHQLRAVLNSHLCTHFC